MSRNFGFFRHSVSLVASASGKVQRPSDSESGSRGQVLAGYLLASGLMALAAIVAWRLGIRSERQPLETVARPLSWQDE